jgi:ring-1,2-phenylacetyl-CoA epoxidase subunit PaaE
MSTPQFYSLAIKERRSESQDGFSLAFEVPPELRDVFTFQQGQYVTLKANVDSEQLRRSYSICNGTPQYERNGELRIGIKRVEGGKFSQYAFDNLQAGQRIEVMAPQGRFTLNTHPDQALHYVGFAAGSGITPILSFMQTILALEPKSKFTLVYGNRGAQHIMFLESIEGLKNQYMDRVRLIHILSGQPQESELFNGRINGEKIRELNALLLPIGGIDRALICGPDSMIDSVTQALAEGGLTTQQILSERFGTPVASSRPKTTTAAFAGSSGSVPSAALQVVLDGKTRSLKLPYEGTNLLDVALAAGMDLPYACKGGVCCTCRAKVLDGEVRMEKNYTLEQWEVDKGFVLTCQCVPVSASVTVSFDER